MPEHELVAPLSRVRDARPMRRAVGFPQPGPVPTLRASTARDRVRVLAEAIPRRRFTPEMLSPTLVVTPDAPLPPGIQTVVADSRYYQSTRMATDADYWVLESPPIDGTDAASEFAVHFSPSAVQAEILLFELTLLFAPAEGKSEVVAELRHADAPVSTLARPWGPLLLQWPAIWATPWHGYDTSALSIRVPASTPQAGGTLYVKRVEITGAS